MGGGSEGWQSKVQYTNMAGGRPRDPFQHICMALEAVTPSRVCKIVKGWPHRMC